MPEARPEMMRQLSRGTGAVKQGFGEPDQGLDAAAGTAQPVKRSRGRPGKALAKKSKEEPHQDAGEAAKTAQQAKHGRPSRDMAKKGDEEPEQAAEGGPSAAQQAERDRPRKGVAKKRGKGAREAAGGRQQMRRSQARAEAAASLKEKHDDRTDSERTGASVRRLAALTESQAAADTLAKVTVPQRFQGLAQQHGYLEVFSGQMHEVMRDPECLSILQQVSEKVGFQPAMD